MHINQSSGRGIRNLIRPTNNRVCRRKVEEQPVIVSVYFLHNYLSISHSECIKGDAVIVKVRVLPALHIIMSL